MEKLKIVLHCQVSDGQKDSYYGNNGLIHREIEKKLGEEIVMVGFGGYLTNENLDKFLAECQDANVVIIDALTHPEHNNWVNEEFDAEEEMMIVAQKIRTANPKAVIYANLIGGESEAKVHQYAWTIHSWTDERIITALKVAKTSIERKLK